MPTQSGTVRPTQPPADTVAVEFERRWCIKLLMCLFVSIVNVFDVILLAMSGCALNRLSFRRRFTLSQANLQLFCCCCFFIRRNKHIFWNYNFSGFAETTGRLKYFILIFKIEKNNTSIFILYNFSNFFSDNDAFSLASSRVNSFYF